MPALAALPHGEFHMSYDDILVLQTLVNLDEGRDMVHSHWHDAVQQYRRHLDCSEDVAQLYFEGTIGYCTYGIAHDGARRRLWETGMG